MKNQAAAVTVLLASAVMTVVLGVEVAMIGMIRTCQIWRMMPNDADMEVFLQALVGSSENEDITLVMLNIGWVFVLNPNWCWMTEHKNKPRKAILTGAITLTNKIQESADFTNTSLDLLM